MSDDFKIPNISQKLFKIRNNEAKGTSVVGHCCWKVGLRRGHREEACKSRAGREQAAVVKCSPNVCNIHPSHNLCTNSPRYADSPEDRGNINLRPKSSHHVPVPHCRSFNQYWFERCTSPSLSLPPDYWSTACRNEYKSCTGLQNLHDDQFFHSQRSSDRECD